MLVQNSVYRNLYLTDGVNKDFYFSFPILESSQVLVQTSLLTNTDVVTTVDPGQYTVTGVGQTTGGHISFTTAPPTGSRIALTLNIPITQLYQYAELDSFPAKSHEDALAKLTLICQQLREQLERAVMLPPTSSESSETVVAHIYTSRDAAVASASAASNKADAAEVSAQAAANSASTAAQTVTTAAAEAVSAATAQANAAHDSALAAAQSAAEAALIPATTTAQGIGRVATSADLVDGATINNGPAFLAAGDVVSVVGKVIDERRFVVGEFYDFRHPTLKPGFAPLQGGLISGAYQGKNITEYPIWAYLQTTEGQKLCKTEAEWRAMSTAIWHTNADGSTVGWNGIGGVPYYAPNLGAGSLRMPDVRGMYPEAAGFDSLGVGEGRGDCSRRVQGNIYTGGAESSGYEEGALYPYAFDRQTRGTGTSGSTYGKIGIDSARVVPTGNANAPRRWGALACCYLGQPT